MNNNLLEGRSILLGVTGSIAAYKACELLRLLKKEGANIQVMMSESAEKFIGVATLAALSNNEVTIPSQINLLNIYRNPFNTTVNFNIEINSPGQININTYSINGNLIESIYDGFISSGTHSFQWNAVNYPSGLYIINLTQDKNSISKKVVLLK